MFKEELKKLLNQFKAGKISEKKLFEKLLLLQPENLEFTVVDHHRKLRKGFPEVIFCQGKTPIQVRDIAKKILERNEPLLATRADEVHFKALKKKFRNVYYHKTARVIYANKPEKPKAGKKPILVITAGTIDIPVAEEAAITAEMLRNPVDKLYDVGVAGIHRLFFNFEKILKANVIIVVAGMEGALPSVVGGLVDVPVIAVPTSGGYGASFGGVAALLGMLNTCASGVTVVNIDNGFGAGFAASLMNR
ncbi:MAG: Circadian phase modifier [Ignavibacteriae bacterium]|nr:MAG: Circadian phase modifier [Ignavibacteriota bacterium]